MLGSYEVFYKPSQQGEELCEDYRLVRKRCLLDDMDDIGLSGENMRKLGSALRAMSGQYDQASRAASSL